MNAADGSFARTADERDAFQLRAQDLVGLAIIRVRYADIDYERYVRAPSHRGPRPVIDEGEWSQPSWRYKAFDAIDYGIEIETTANRLFTMTWDPPVGLRESVSAKYPCSASPPPTMQTSQSGTSAGAATGRDTSASRSTGWPCITSHRVVPPHSTADSGAPPSHSPLPAP
jgi:hypothetical protein